MLKKREQDRSGSEDLRLGQQHISQRTDLCCCVRSRRSPPSAPNGSPTKCAKTRLLRRMLNGTAYFDRPAPRFAPVKLLTLAFTPELFIESALGSNCPRSDLLTGPVGVDFWLSGFLCRFRLCSLAGLSFGHVFFAFLSSFVEL